MKRIFVVINSKVLLSNRSHIFHMGGINIVKMSIPLKAIYRLNEFLSKYHDNLHRTRTNNPKIHMEPWKTLNC